MRDDRTHLLIIGGGPAGTQAATTAATKGARVTLVEKDIIGGAAHLLERVEGRVEGVPRRGADLLFPDLGLAEAGHAGQGEQVRDRERAGRHPNRGAAPAVQPRHPAANAQRCRLHCEQRHQQRVRHIARLGEQRQAVLVARVLQETKAPL